jgi:hypothetical protein
MVRSSDRTGCREILEVISSDAFGHEHKGNGRSNDRARRPAGGQVRLVGVTCGTAEVYKARQGVIWASNHDCCSLEIAGRDNERRERANLGLGKQHLTGRLCAD